MIKDNLWHELTKRQVMISVENSKESVFYLKHIRLSESDCVKERFSSGEYFHDRTGTNLERIGKD